MNKTGRIRKYLLGRLEEMKGQHTAIAAEAGLSQAAISRFYLGKAEPRLGAVDALLDWFDKDDEAKGKPPRSALFPGDRAGIARRRRSSTAAASPVRR